MRACKYKSESEGVNIVASNPIYLILSQLPMGQSQLVITGLLQLQ